MQLSNEDFGKYLEHARKQKGYSTYDVNKLTDISQSYISLIEKGKRKASAVILKTLAPIYGLDYIDLYEKAGYVDLIEDENDKLLKRIGAVPLINTDTVKIPVLGTVKAGYDYLAQENIVDHIFFKVDGTDIQNYYALNIIGDSMEPLFSNGDIVIVHKQENFENGDNCVVLINGEEATVKKVYKRNNGIELKAVNPYYPPKIFTKEEIKDLPVKIVGVVEKSIRNFKRK